MSITDIDELEGGPVSHPILQSALELLQKEKQELQDRVDRLEASLANETRERYASEEQLQKRIQATLLEKKDLETLVQILIDQGDDSADEGEKARIDGLTQIPNRRRFDEYLLQEWNRHIRMQRPISLLICDVDHFKLYNDTQGHQAGDDCLKIVAHAINQRFRSGDLVARYGGEEFAVTLPQTDSVGALQVAERILSFVAAAAIPHATSPICNRVTISIGVATKTPAAGGPSDARALIEEADRHLYLAKQRGRNQVSYQDGEATI